MGIGAGNIAFKVPPSDDDQVRRQRDTERQQRENAASRSLEATSIGRGGLTVIGGFINITAGGTFSCDGNATFNGSLTVPAGSLNTAGSITAGTSLNANSLAIVAGATIGGTLTVGAVSAGSVTASGQVLGNTGVFPTGVNSTGVYNTLLTYGGAYSSQYVHVDGTMGYVPSSRRYKRDIASAVLDPAVLSYLRVVTYRYITAVENLGSGAAVEVGLIAEEVDALGLKWLVDYDAEGLPMGVRYDRLALIFIPWMQSVEDRLTAAGI